MSFLQPLLRSRRALYVLGAVAVVSVGMAMPRFLTAFSEADPNAHPVDPVPYVASAAGSKATPYATYTPSRSTDTRSTMDVSAFRSAAVAPTVEATKDGDLAVSLALRWPEFETGERVLAKVRFANHSTSLVHLPASAEPNPGLAIVVEDADGHEVRRVVETGRGGELPHRLIKLGAGCEAQIPVVLVADGETPLEPGKYIAWVEMAPDPLLARLGLPIWTAPSGPIRSEAVSFAVTARPQ